MRGLLQVLLYRRACLFDVRGCVWLEESCRVDGSALRSGEGLSQLLTRSDELGRAVPVQVREVFDAREIDEIRIEVEAESA